MKLIIKKLSDFNETFTEQLEQLISDINNGKTKGNNWQILDNNQLPDEISITWSIEDVKSIDNDLTDEECRQVLEMTRDGHDATMGITWDTLEYWVDEIKSERN